MQRILKPSAAVLIVAGLASVTLAAVGSGAGWVGAPDTAAEMTSAARAYLSTLGADARERGTWELDADQRFDWHFIPREREGLPLKDMTPDQREAAHRLLGSVLSSQGYLKATGVQQLEGILGGIEGRPDFRDPEDYYVNIFGEPSAEAAWAWRFEGHHISMNVTAAGGDVPSMTPTFMGSNPHVVREGTSAGWSLLAAEEGLARDLMALLDDRRRATAIIQAEAPRDIITGNERRVSLDRYEGLRASEMTEAQRAALMTLIEEYLHNARHDIAHTEMERIREAGLENLYFAWAGPTERGEGHYYRVHGPTILIEYDNVQGGANHVHSVWRDPQNDFGDDLLRRHYEEADHHRR